MNFKSFSVIYKDRILIYNIDMKRIPYKVRLVVGTISVILSIFLATITISLHVSNSPLWSIVLVVVSAFILFVVGMIMMPTYKDDGTPIVTTKKNKKKKKHKNKKPFISNKEWKEEDEEDDEMMFIEEYIEDDK